jgi:hypothetical protein
VELAALEAELLLAALLKERPRGTSAIIIDGAEATSLVHSPRPSDSKSTLASLNGRSSEYWYWFTLSEIMLTETDAMMQKPKMPPQGNPLFKETRS